MTDLPKSFRIPCDAKYYFVPLPFSLSEWDAQKSAILEPGPAQHEVRGSFTLYESPIDPAGLYVGDRYIINYGKQQDLRVLSSHPFMEFLPLTNQPVVLLHTLDMSRLVRGNSIEESLRRQGISFYEQSRHVGIVRNFITDTLYAGPCGYLSDSLSYVVNSTYSIYDYQLDPEKNTWKRTGDQFATFRGHSTWRFESGFYMDGNKNYYRTILPLR